MAMAITAQATSTYRSLPQTVQVIMPYGPGGAGDLQVRHFQQYLNSKGIAIVQNYKPGGDGVIAMQELSRADRNGSVISFTSAGFIANAEVKLSSEIAAPISIASITLNAFITHPNSKYASLREFEHAIKTNDHKLDIGYHAIGNLTLMNEYFVRINKDNTVLRIPFKTPVQSSTAVAGGHVQTAVVPMSVAIALAESNQITIICVAGPTSFKLPGHIVNVSKNWPDWKHADGFLWALPARTPPDVVDRWVAVIKEYQSDPQTVDFLTRNFLGTELAGPGPAAKLINRAHQHLKK